MTTETLFCKLEVGAQFFDPDTLETFVKEGGNYARVVPTSGHQYATLCVFGPTEVVKVDPLNNTDSEGGETC